MTKKDKQILNEIIMIIADETSLEDFFADAIEKSQNIPMSQDEFHDWITKAKVR